MDHWLEKLPENDEETAENDEFDAKMAENDEKLPENGEKMAEKDSKSTENDPKTVKNSSKTAQNGSKDPKMAENVENWAIFMTAKAWGKLKSEIRGWRKGKGYVFVIISPFLLFFCFFAFF
jgi:hypothetical protein